MRRQKTIDKNGKISVTKSEERYPYASEVLMKHGGFIIIFLNMTFGLLPVTFWGSRIKYFKCSISELNATVNTLCFIAFSFIFLPVIFFGKQENDEEGRESLTGLVVLMAMGVTHIFGYVVLLLRGHFVARGFPAAWKKLCKLFQLAVIDIHGKDYDLLKVATRFTRWAVFEFFFVTSGTSLGSAIYSESYDDGLDEAFKYYKLEVALPIEPETFFEHYKSTCLHAGYFLWNLCNSSHVLVTMLICYVVIIITICLKSVNNQIREVLEAVDNNAEDDMTGRETFPSSPFAIPIARSRGSSLLDENNENVVIGRLNRAKNVFIIIEDLLKTVSTLWGIFLMIEVLILIASGTTEAYKFLSCFKGSEGEANEISYRFPGPPEWIGVIHTVSVNFYFLFKCCIYVDRMQFEARTTLQLLKRPSCQRMPVNIQEKIEDLKQDVTCASVILSASNYFQINKFLLTSIASQITTYVVVLLQFSQQEDRRNSKS